MNIPTFQEAWARVEAKNFTALDRFVFDNEPDGEDEERQFRDGLQAVVDELMCDLDQRQGEVVERNCVIRELRARVAELEAFLRDLADDTNPTGPWADAPVHEAIVGFLNRK